MRRRELLLLGTGIMAARAVRAQQKAMPVIGFLGCTSPDLYGPVVAAFRQGLTETGYVERKNLAVEYRWALGDYDRLSALAADLVRRNVEVIATVGNPAAVAAKSATSTIPIVFGIGGDPVELGFVTSLARPSGNLTGVTIINVELIPKRFELISELVPWARVIALLVNPNNPGSDRIIRDLQEVARTRGRDLAILKAGTESEIDAALASLAQPQSGVLVVRSDPVFLQSARTARDAGRTSCRSGDLSVARVPRGRWPDQLWKQPHRGLAPGWGLCRPNSRGRQAGRSAGPATDAVRAGGKSQHRQGARSDDPAVDPRPRR